jgi:catechol 2,3-dioxygenase-like lactoylglutathione lyase family enzyme
MSAGFRALEDNVMEPSVDEGLDKVKVVQIGLNTSDLAGSLQLYHELFGFENAGGNVLWGNVMRMQGLEPGARSLIWWMVGGASFFQLEFFTHSKPRQRPLPPDWRPSDHGWVRFGISVNDFAAVVQGLERWNIAALGGVNGAAGSRRLAFRDPHVGAVVEVVESTSPTAPTMTYATSSVADLAAARHYYRDVIGCELEPIEGLHSLTDEALWGLEGAEREGFVVRFGDIAVEVLEYTAPAGRARPDRLISDQGIMNIALGSRDVGVVRALLGRLRAAGHTSTYVFEGLDVVGTYIVDPGCELEIFASPEANDSAIGFKRAGPFLVQFTSA